jgi:hypothetical protein
MMKAHRIFLFAILAVPLLVYGQEPAEPFSVERFLTATGVEDREPVGENTVFPAETERVYSFLELRNVQQDTDITFIWYAGENAVGEVTLPVQQGDRWRTYSYKTIGGVTGEWRVELNDSEGNTINSISFSVE